MTAVLAFRHTLDWPLHEVRARLTLVHPRKLGPLEWAVLRWIEQWAAEERPALDELARALFVDVQFLQDALDDTIRLGAVRRADCGSLTLSDRGRELFGRGLIEGAPFHRDVKLAIDAVTDLDVPPAACTRAVAPLRPAVDVAPRTALGLDRARVAVAKYQPEELGDGGEIREVQTLGSELVWRRTNVEGRIEDGSLRLVAELDPEALAILSDLPTAIPEEARGDARRARPIRHTPLDALRLEQALADAIGTARHEILATASWQRSARIREALVTATRRGVRVVVIEDGEELTIPPIETRDVDPTEQMFVDGRTGFQESHVCLRCGTALRLIEQLDAEHVASARRELLVRHLPWVAALEACAPEERLSLALTADSLRGHPATWIRQLVLPASPTIAQVLSVFELELDAPATTAWLEDQLRRAPMGDLSFAQLLRKSVALQSDGLVGAATLLHGASARASFVLESFDAELDAIAELVPPHERARHVIARARAGARELLRMKERAPDRWAALRARIEKFGVPGIALDAALVASSARAPKVHGVKRKGGRR